MQVYTISKPDSKLFGEITLSPSKSISNRDIVIRALQNAKFDAKSISEKDAAKVINKDIREGEVSLDRGEPAKAIRFLRAFLAYFKGDWIVTGSAEMRKRPVGDIIDFLHNQGINVKYIERDGFPPLKIIGKGIKGNIIRIDTSICSQFINTSLLISSSVSADDVVEFKNRIISSPYIDQTIRLLRYLGINSYWDKDEILIEHELHDTSDITIEADWLSASYWYQMAALSSSLEFAINGLNPDSVQSDAIVKELFEPLGIKTTKTATGVLLTKTPRKINHFTYDFTNNPHLIPTMVVTCVGLNIPFTFAGIEVMNCFEPDRKMVLQTQLAKLKANLLVEKKGVFEIMKFDGKASFPKGQVVEFTPFDDHRIAMAFASLAITGNRISLENPRVVSKSYPSFWDDVKRVGISVE